MPRTPRQRFPRIGATCAPRRLERGRTSFLVGGVTSPAGTVYLVGLSCTQQWCAGWSCLRFTADEFVVGSFISGPKASAVDEELGSFLIPSRRRVRFSRIQISGDGRRFSFDFASGDESGRIDGTITDDGHVALSARDGSGNIASGGKLMVQPLLRGEERARGLLYAAAEARDTESVRRLLKSGVGADQDRTKYGSAPLMAAAFKGHTDVMRQLLAAGADANAETYEGETPLDYACDGGRVEAASILLAAGASCRHLDYRGCSALYHAVAFGGSRQGTVGGGNLLLARLLIEHGAEVNTAVAPVRATPLHCAAFNGNRAVVELLIASGARIDASDKDGRTR